MSLNSHIIERFQNKKTETIFEKIYGNCPDIVNYQTKRYINLLSKFHLSFQYNDSVNIFSTPARVEIGGNHTDHNAGKVLSAAVNLDIIAAVSKNSTNEIVIESDGFPKISVNLNNLAMIKNEKYTSAALLKGICARMKELGYEIGGFHACFMSSIPSGSGLSSSAAFEVLIVTILDNFYNGGRILPISMAQIARYSENFYFGKPCGLMDQITCSTGGLVAIDFRDISNPEVKKIEYDFTSSGFSLAIVNTGSSHADLTEDYAAVESEMKEVAFSFGGDMLQSFSKKKIMDNLPFLRKKISDRAILRALHFYSENQRVSEQVMSLEKGNLDEFMKLIIESGYSSWMMCQNCYSAKTVHEQPLSIALSVCESILKEKGAWRIHGGGFAGTILAFVPKELKEVFFNKMREIFGIDSCHDLYIRRKSSIMLDI